MRERFPQTATPTAQVLRPGVVAAMMTLAVIGLAACGTESDSADAAAARTTTVETVTDDDDHDDDHDDHDDDHDDDDHDDDASSGLGAHEHGAAELSVAWIDGDVAIDLISPTFNVFGFEYEPQTDEDLATASDRTDALTATGVIAINEEANCAQAEPAATEVEREGSHSEIMVSWLFVCENPDQIKQIDASALFAEFPSFEDIDAQWISASDQSSAELTPQSPTLLLER